MKNIFHLILAQILIVSLHSSEIPDLDQQIEKIENLIPNKNVDLQFLKGTDPEFFHSTNQVLEEFRGKIRFSTNNSSTLIQDCRNNLLPLVRGQISILQKQVQDAGSRYIKVNGKNERVEGIPLPANFEDNLVFIMLVLGLEPLDLGSSLMEEYSLGTYKLTIGETFERLFNQRFRRLEPNAPRDQPNEFASRFFQEGDLHPVILNYIRSIKTSNSVTWAIKTCSALGLKEEGLSIARKTISEPLTSNFWIKNEDKPPRALYSAYSSACSILYEWGRFDDAELLIKILQGIPPYDIDKNSYWIYLAGCSAKLLELNPVDHGFRVRNRKVESFSDQSFPYFSLFDEKNKRDTFTEFLAYIDLTKPFLSVSKNDPKIKATENGVKILIADNKPAHKTNALSLISEDPVLAFSYLNTIDENHSIRGDAIRKYLSLEFAKNFETSKKQTLHSLKAKLTKLFGEVGKAQSCFEDLVNSQPKLMMLYDGLISSKGSERELYSQSLYLEYRKVEASLVQEFENKVNDANAKKLRQPGKVFPPGLDIEFMKTLCALTFIQSEFGKEKNIVAFDRIFPIFTSGLGLGVYKTKSPVLQFIRSNKNLGENLKFFITRLCLESDDYMSLKYACNISLRYGFKELGQELAVKILSEYKKFEEIDPQGKLLEFSIHCLLIFGEPAKHLKYLIPLLENKFELRLAGYASKQERKFIEVREFALMAIYRMASLEHPYPSDAKISGYCPIKRFVKLDVVKDPARWLELNEIIANLRKQYSF